MRVKQKILSTELTEHLWKNPNFPCIYILDKIRTIQTDCSDFLVKYCGYKSTTNNVSGNVVLHKGNQRMCMAELLDII